MGKILIFTRKDFGGKRYNPFKGTAPIWIEGVGERSEESLYQIVHDHFCLGKAWEFSRRLGTPGKPDCKIPAYIVDAARKDAAENHGINPE